MRVRKKKETGKEKIIFFRSAIADFIGSLFSTRRITSKLCSIPFHCYYYTPTIPTPRAPPSPPLHTFQRNKKRYIYDVLVFPPFVSPILKCPICWGKQKAYITTKTERKEENQICQPNFGALKHSQLNERYPSL